LKKKQKNQKLQFSIFNSENKKESELTYDDIYKPALSISDKKDAKQYFNKCVEFVQRSIDNKEFKTAETAEYVVIRNLKWFINSHKEGQEKEELKKLFNLI